MNEEELSPKEEAHNRRRDRDADAEARSLMNNGSSKWFKQALDRQLRDAKEGPRRKTKRKR